MAEAKRKKCDEECRIGWKGEERTEKKSRKNINIIIISKQTS